MIIITECRPDELMAIRYLSLGNKISLIGITSSRPLEHKAILMKYLCLIGLSNTQVICGSKYSKKGIVHNDNIRIAINDILQNVEDHTGDIVLMTGVTDFVKSIPLYESKIRNCYISGGMDGNNRIMTNWTVDEYAVKKLLKSDLCLVVFDATYQTDFGNMIDEKTMPLFIEKFKEQSNEGYLKFLHEYMNKYDKNNAYQLCPSNLYMAISIICPDLCKYDQLNISIYNGILEYNSGEYYIDNANLAKSFDWSLCEFVLLSNI
jgi:hypothetical protein